MRGKASKERFWKVSIAATLVVSLAVIAAGCGSTANTTSQSSGSPATPSAAGAPSKLYVAVTGAGELQGAGNMGYAVVDLATKKVQMVNIPEAKAPHGITFTTDTKTADNTTGLVAVGQPKTIYLGNAQDGAVVQVDLATQKATSVISPPATAKLAICGMNQGPDNKIWLSSMADGKVYPLDAGAIGANGIGGGNATNSICAIAWGADGGPAYLSQMGANANQSGYVARIDWPGGNLQGKIDNITSPSPKDGGLVSHQMLMTPDGQWLYVTDGADGSLTKVDVATGQIVKKIPLGGGEPHAIVFSTDGKTAYIAVRHYPVDNESGVVVYDVEKDQPVEHISGIPAGLVCGIVLQES